MKIIFYSLYLFFLRVIRALFLFFVLYPLFLLVLLSLKLLFFFFTGPDSSLIKNNLSLKSSFFGDSFLKEWSLPFVKSNLFFRTFKIFRPLQDFYLLKERQQLFYHLFFDEHYNIVFRSLNSFFYSLSSRYNSHFNALFFFFLFDSSIFRLIFHFPLFVFIKRVFLYYFYFFFWICLFGFFIYRFYFCNVFFFFNSFN